MTPQELLSACEGRDYIQLVSPDGKRPIPYVKAELLCAAPHDGRSVWLYKTKSVLRAMKNAGMTRTTMKIPGQG